MLSTQHKSGKPAFLAHQDHGNIPAKVVLDCVFAISPSGEILHHHAEEFSAEESDAEVIFKVNGQSPNDTRSRCQIIPPRIPQFPNPIK